MIRPGPFLHDYIEKCRIPSVPPLLYTIRKSDTLLEQTGTLYANSTFQQYTRDII